MIEVQDAQWASIHFWLGHRSMDEVERARGVQLRVGMGRMRIPGGVVCSGWLGMVAGNGGWEQIPARSLDHREAISRDGQFRSES